MIQQINLSMGWSSRSPWIMTDYHLSALNIPTYSHSDTAMSPWWVDAVQILIFLVHRIQKHHKVHWYKHWLMTEVRWRCICYEYTCNQWLAIISMWHPCSWTKQLLNVICFMNFMRRIFHQVEIITVSVHNSVLA